MDILAHEYTYLIIYFSHSKQDWAILENDLVLSRLLIRLAEDVNVPARLVGRVGGVVTSAVLAQSADLLHLLGEELDLLEVITDARRGD